jgi:hypothetical protein
VNFRLLPLLLLIFIIAFPVFSQETSYNEDIYSAFYESRQRDNDAPDNEENLNEFDFEDMLYFDEDTIFIITSFDFNVKGRTRPYAVLYKAEMKRGEVITGVSNLQK